MKEKAAVIFIMEEKGLEKDLEIPLDITAGDLVTALNKAYDLGIDTSDIKNCYLKTEHPTAFLKGNVKLSDLGVRNGTVIRYR